MSSGLTPPRDAVRRQMQSQKTTGTKIEMDVRRSLHALGFRYRVNRKLLTGYPWRGDIVWSRRKVVVFLDGCFWHGCPIHGTTPKSNTEWWLTKIEANRQRDLRVDAILREKGWTVLRFWEHEDSEEITASVIKHLRR